MSTQTKGKHGGKREGAGRPAGSKNTLEYGEVKAVKAARLRVPEAATPEAAELADRAQQRIIDVMEDRVHYTSAPSVLKAATRLREEICGVLAQKQEISGADGGPVVIEVRKLAPEGGQ